MHAATLTTTNVLGKILEALDHRDPKGGMVERTSLELQRAVGASVCIGTRKTNMTDYPIFDEIHGLGKYAPPQSDTPESPELTVDDWERFAEIIENTPVLDKLWWTAIINHDFDAQANLMEAATLLWQEKQCPESEPIARYRKYARENAKRLAVLATLDLIQRKGQ